MVKVNLSGARSHLGKHIIFSAFLTFSYQNILLIFIHKQPKASCCYRKWVSLRHFLMSWLNHSCVNVSSYTQESHLSYIVRRGITSCGTNITNNIYKERLFDLKQANNANDALQFNVRNEKRERYQQQTGMFERSWQFLL